MCQQWLNQSGRRYPLNNWHNYRMFKVYGVLSCVIFPSKKEDWLDRTRWSLLARTIQFEWYPILIQFAPTKEGTGIDPLAKLSVEWSSPSDHVQTSSRIDWWPWHPICSMYGIFTYIWVIFRGNVDKYCSTREHMGICRWRCVFFMFV